MRDFEPDALAGTGLPDTLLRGDRMIGRRQLTTLFGSVVAAWPVAVRAQQPGRLPTIGILGASNGPLGGVPQRRECLGTDEYFASDYDPVLSVLDLDPPCPAPLRYGRSRHFETDPAIPVASPSREAGGI